MPTAKTRETPNKLTVRQVYLKYPGLTNEIGVERLDRKTVELCDGFGVISTKLFMEMGV